MRLASRVMAVRPNAEPGAAAFGQLGECVVDQV